MNKKNEKSKTSHINITLEITLVIYVYMYIYNYMNLDITLVINLGKIIVSCIRNISKPIITYASDIREYFL